MAFWLVRPTHPKDAISTIGYVKLQPFLADNSTHPPTHPPTQLLAYSTSFQPPFPALSTYVYIAHPPTHPPSPGAISTIGYVKLQPFLADNFNLQDTCGIHNLHGMPGKTHPPTPLSPCLLFLRTHPSTHLQ